MIDLLKKHKVISNFIWAIIGALIGWLIPSKPVEVANLPKKELTCTLNYSQQLITVNKKDDNFNIMYESNEISDPYIFSITIKNTGNFAIDNEDFEKDLSIDFNGSNKIIKASIVEFTNDEILDDILDNCIINDSKLIFSDFFLNPYETFTINIITDGNPDKINYNYRINGISDLNLINTTADKLKELNNLKNHFLLILIVVFIAFVIMIIAFRIKDIKTIRKLQQILSVESANKTHDSLNESKRSLKSKSKK